MGRFGAIGLFAALLFLLGASSPAPPPDLAGISGAWAADWSAAKLDALMALYAPDAVFHPTSGERWVGTTEIRKNCAAGLSQFHASLHLQSLRSLSSGDLGFDSGAFEEDIVPVKGGKAMHSRGTYLFVFTRRPSGEWKVLEQTWTEYDPSRL